MTTAPPEPAVLDDAVLAVAAAGGDRAAFAAIYDRYADRLYDFGVGMLRDPDAAADCVQDAFVEAATQLGALRDPSRLRPWLYAIVRNRALARIRARRRELPSDDLPDVDSGEPELAALVARDELAALVAAACGALTDRDRMVFDLTYRHGLDGPELAQALGVTHTNANTLSLRLRDGVERSLGALLLCRRVQADPSACPELARIVEGWDGEFTALLRKRAARHIDGCATCDAERRRRVNPVALLGAVPVFVPAPALLRTRTLEQSQATIGLPAPAEAARRWLARAALAAVFVMLGIAGVAQLAFPLRVDDAVEPAAPGGATSVSSSQPSGSVTVQSVPPSAPPSEPAPSIAPPTFGVTTAVTTAPTVTTVPTSASQPPARNPVSPTTRPANSFSPTTRPEPTTSRPTRTSTSTRTSPTSTSSSTTTPPPPPPTSPTSDPIE